MFSRFEISRLPHPGGMHWVRAKCHNHPETQKTTANAATTEARIILNIKVGPPSSASESTLPVRNLLYRRSLCIGEGWNPGFIAWFSWFS
jgi:hypothetical protein